MTVAIWWKSEDLIWVSNNDYSVSEDKLQLFKVEGLKTHKVYPGSAIATAWKSRKIKRLYRLQPDGAHVVWLENWILV